MQNWRPSFFLKTLACIKCIILACIRALSLKWVGSSREQVLNSLQDETCMRTQRKLVAVWRTQSISSCFNHPWHFLKHSFVLYDINNDTAIFQICCIMCPGHWNTGCDALVSISSSRIGLTDKQVQEQIHYSVPVCRIFVYLFFSRMTSVK